MKSNETENNFKTELLIKKYYDYNKTKFNIFSIEQKLSAKKRKFYYYISGMVATIILIFTVLFNYHYKQEDADFLIAFNGEVISEEINNIIFNDIETANYLTVLYEIEDGISDIQENFHYNYDEYLAYLRY